MKYYIENIPRALLSVDISHRLHENNVNVIYSDLIYNEAITKIEHQAINGKYSSDFG